MIAPARAVTARIGAVAATVAVLCLGSCRPRVTPGPPEYLLAPAFEEAEVRSDGFDLGVEEKDFVRFMLGVQKGIVAIMASDGQVAIFLADQNNSLKAYTHTVVMAVIGALIEDEIL